MLGAQRYKFIHFIIIIILPQVVTCTEAGILCSVHSCSHAAASIKAEEEGDGSDGKGKGREMSKGACSLQLK